MKEDNISQLADYDAPFFEQQYTHGFCYISLFKFKSFDQFNTPQTASNFRHLLSCDTIVTDRISNLKGHFKSPKCKVLDQPDVKDTLHKLQTNYVLVPADKAANNVIIVCKKYYIDTLVKELGINNVSISNPTYIPIDGSFETIVKSHNQFITSVGLEMSEQDQNLPYLYWTPKLHKSPYKH